MMMAPRLVKQPRGDGGNKSAVHFLAAGLGLGFASTASSPPPSCEKKRTARAGGESWEYMRYE